RRSCGSGGAARRGADKVAEGADRAKREAERFTVDQTFPSRLVRLLRKLRALLARPATPSGRRRAPVKWPMMCFPKRAMFMSVPQERRVEARKSPVRPQRHGRSI
ncbi:MAG: hypothetical protein WKF84_05460, partial [Pyrinomonadaceae bacterium]